MPVIKLEGIIKTNNYGINKIINFYDTAKRYINTTISIDFYNLDWIDANLCAFLQSILFKLKKERNLEFSTDESFLRRNFDILIRNGFFMSDENAHDERESTVTLKSFKKNEISKYCTYIENDLLKHRSIANKDDLKDNIIENLLEVFNNYTLHAETDHPVFICGQYYPKNNELIFTMVDMGIGFLIPINRKVKEINTYIKAIRWALIDGNSTKDMKNTGTPGGLGLFDLHQYMIKSGGIMEIVSGDVYWTSKHAGTNFDTYKTLCHRYDGTIINLVFNCN